VVTMPSYDGRNRFTVDFAEGNNGAGLPAAGNRFDDQARVYMTCIPGLREQPGFGSVGELLAVRIEDRGADQTRILPDGSRPPTNTLRVGNQPNNGTVLKIESDLNIAAQLSMDRFGRDNQPADYTFQRRAVGPTAGVFVSTDSEPQIPLALTATVSSQTLSQPYTTPGNANFARPIDVPRDVTFPGGTPPAPSARIDPKTMANLRPSSAVDSYEEKLIIANALLNTVSVRSDIFCAYFVLNGYQQSDIDGLSNVAGEAGFDQPMVPTLKRRYMMVVDRSNVTKPGDKPKILMFQELPAE
jgi:hypothetical protein